MSNPRDTLRAFAFSLPETWEDFPWDESVAKVGKKVFVFFGHGADTDVGMSVKLPHSMVEALAEPWCTPTGYGLGKAGWVSVRIPTGTAVPTERLLAWIEESYRAVALVRHIKQLDAGRAST
jgi:predicted DNA-binding protein (MmcQ/YjbR family)